MTAPTETSGAIPAGETVKREAGSASDPVVILSDAAERVCHKEQMQVWSNEVAGCLSMGNYLRDDLSYDDGISLCQDLGREIKRIVEGAFDHPELLALARSPAPAVPESVRRLSEAADALRGISEDFMTSERHHPGHVLIPTAKFERLCAAELSLSAPAPAPAHGSAESEGLSQAARDVLAERRRQVEVERFDAAFDDRYARDELSTAAAIYAAAPSVSWRPWLEKQWPWAHGWFKRSSRRRDLVKSGALILAEIERLDRATRPATPAEGR